jgi:hypothetical protein
VLRVIVVIQVEIVPLRVKAAELVREDEPTVALAAFPALQDPLAVKLTWIRSSCGSGTCGNCDD